MKNILLTLIILLTIAACSQKSDLQAQFVLEEAFPNLRFNNPVEMVSPDDNSNRLFVVLQGGIIEFFDNNANVGTKNTFLNISSKVISGGERGLLGLAFHPNFKQNGWFYVNYTRNNPNLQTVISRFNLKSGNVNEADPNSELILMTFDQPFANHNGGKIAFGNDAYLYIATGDGGSGGDPQDNGQTLRTLLGKILRIDVNTTEGILNYAIPTDNPYKNNSQGYKQEIFAYGLRNPWKFAVDKNTGQIWVADVGQNAFEEIDIVEKGKNYGWRVMEAKSCYNPSQNCNQNGLILPVWFYSQDNGDRSITGGYVYRGKEFNSLKGKYIYGDYVSGRIWALDVQGQAVSNEFLLNANGQISSFGEDQNKELYVCIHGGNGKIMKFKDLNVTSLFDDELRDKITLNAFPNPSQNQIDIWFYLPYPSQTALDLTDTQGKIIQTFFKDKLFSEGNHQHSFITTQLQSGIYFCRFLVEGLVKTIKIVIN